MLTRGGRRGVWTARTALATALVLATAGCGRGIGGGDGTVGAGKNPDGTSDGELKNPVVILRGGSAMSSAGQAQPGGTAHLVSAGGITISADFSGPSVPDALPSPADAMAIAAEDLHADLNAPGSVSLSGSVTLTGGDAVRQIVAAGDIFVDGTLRSADLGGARQGLTLRAANGTVCVTGSIDTSGDGANAGQTGGALTIVAQRVVVGGKLVTAGGAGSTGGDGGAITIMTTQGVYLTGSFNSAGGAGKDGRSTGGAGGALTIQAGGDVVIGGTGSVGGGAGGSQAGGAGAIAIDTPGTVAFTGTFDGRGGVAIGGNDARAGAAATLKIGEATPAAAIGVTVPLVVTGGDGGAVGGDGGAVNLEAHGGDLRIGTVVDVSGGTSTGKPGAGGTVTGTPGPEADMAGLDLSGRVTANGGDVAQGTGDGAAGGTIKLILASMLGTVTVEPTGQVQADGGRSRGAGTAGAAGVMYLFTKEGDLSMHGQLLARGGAAPDGGGTGGRGGLIYLFTGDGHDRMSGTLIIESDGTIDASGGAGSIGGSARNDGIPASVGVWPSRQDDELDVENIAVLINSNGVHGPDRGWQENRGKVIARGGAANGSGGDVAYHGKRQDGDETPLSGDIDLSADGSGTPGDFAGE